MRDDDELYPAPAEEFAADQPVSRLPGDDASPTAGTALCLSGGGYRAMLFHLGVLWRLNDAGMLPELDRISSVSGGSINLPMSAKTPTDTQNARTTIEATLKRSPMAR